MANSGNYGEDRIYTQVVRAQAGQDFSTGPRPKGIMMVGASAVMHGFDQYGNGFTLQNDTKVGTTLYSISSKTIDHVVENATTKAYILF